MATMSDELAYCTFELDGLFFGVEVLLVQEVIRYQRMTSVPLAPDVVRGLINLRGQVVTAIDLRRRLGMADLPDDRLPMNVVVRTADGPVSLLVDEIGDVIEVDDATFEPPPDTLTGVSAELITGVYKLEDRLLLVLDVDKALRLPALTGSESGS
jgi:purine-binding chemotaxis protein CheW